MYADDMQLYISEDMKQFNKDVRSMNADLAMLYNWCEKHGFNLNVSICKSMTGGHSRLL